MSDADTDMVVALCRYIEAAASPPHLDELAIMAGMGASRLLRVFKAHTGLTPRAYAAAQRARRVREQLAEGVAVTQAMYEAGYSSSGRFYE
jgi:AraC family transcriptional regulator, regulatory protein of adaptative response / methylated-DNA-[protein]-cysteine methyltransferase